jgi:hypothetical protein
MLFSQSHHEKPFKVSSINHHIFLCMMQNFNGNFFYDIEINIILTLYNLFLVFKQKQVRLDQIEVIYWVSVK